jgi:hypothetical protein
MKSVQITIVTMLTLLFLLPTGCRKDDSVSQLEQADEQLMRDFLSDDYFATASEYYNPPPADPSAGTATESRTKTSMTAALKDYFAKNPKEVKNITKDLGYPIWHHTTYAVVEDEEILHIPFAKTYKNKIESVLYVSKSKDQNKLSFNMVLRKDLEKFDREKKIKKNKKVNKKKEQFSSLSKEMAVTTVAYFEQVVFQQVDCALAEMMKDDNFKPDDKVESRECFYVSYSQTTDWYQYGGGNISYLGSSTSYGGQWVCIYTYAYGPDGTTNAGTNTTGGAYNTQTNSNTSNNYELVQCDTHLDTIKVDRSFSSCSVINCIYQKFLNSGQPRFCHNIYRYNYNDKLHLNISVKNLGAADGDVSMTPDGVEMKFDDINCSSNDHIRVAETLLHESAHAKFRYDLFKGTSFSENTYRENFRLWVMNKYGVPYNNDHQLMLKTYMDIVARDLWELNDRKFDPSYYLAWAWEGLERDNQGIFAPDIIAGWRAKQTIVNNNNPFKCR